MEVIMKKQIQNLNMENNSKIKNKRLFLGITRNHISQKMGISIVQLQKYEDGFLSYEAVNYKLNAGVNGHLNA